MTVEGLVLPCVRYSLKDRRKAETAMTKVFDLNDEWLAFRAAHIEWVEGWISPGSESQFEGPEGKVALIQNIVDSGEIPVSETVQLQCLGTYLGQAIVEKTGWDWKVVEDEYGTDLAIQVPDKQAWMFPVTMISKRIEDGELVDVLDLFKGIVPLAKNVDADGSA